MLKLDTNYGFHELCLKYFFFKFTNTHRPEQLFCLSLIGFYNISTFRHYSSTLPRRTTQMWWWSVCRPWCSV